MKFKSLFFDQLVNAAPDFLSGADFADSVGISRAAVWKIVHALESDGFIIEAVPSKGYRLSPENSQIADVLIKKYLNSHDLGNNIIVLDEVSSTNTYAKELASKNAAHGTLVVAKKQSGGKGRLGRRFESPPGCGLYMSFIIRPDFDLSFAPLITSAAAVAAAEAVETLSGHDVQIKWVNDLYMNDKKICGILTEASLDLEMKNLDYAVVGIGIDVLHHDFGEELNQRVTSIETETGKKIDRNRLCAEVLNRFDFYLQNIENRSHLEAYRKRELLTGHRISANVGSESYVGTALDIDKNANLIIKLDDGTLKTLSSGEANMCRKAEK